MIQACDSCKSVCDETDIIQCLAPHNFKVSDIDYLDNTVTLSWEERDSADSYTVLYLENGILSDSKNDITVTTTTFSIDTGDVNRRFEIFSNCTNCADEPVFSDTLTIGIDGILLEDCPTPTGFDAFYKIDSIPIPITHTLTIKWDTVGSTIYDPTYYFVNLTNLEDATDTYILEVEHPTDSVVFDIDIPLDANKSLFRVEIHQSCNPDYARLIGDIEIVHDDPYRCMNPTPSNPKLYLLVCRHGKYSGLSNFLNCHCNGAGIKTNIDPNCN